MNADHAAGLVASERLLLETLDYLMRLPVNPMTAQLARKIRTHLEDPAQAREVRDAALVINAAEQNRDLRSGVAWYTQRACRRSRSWSWSGLDALSQRFPRRQLDSMAEHPQASSARRSSSTR